MRIILEKKFVQLGHTDNKIRKTKHEQNTNSKRIKNHKKSSEVLELQNKTTPNKSTENFNNILNHEKNQ